MSELAVITGASSGIGRAMAQRLATEGLSVISVGRRSAPLEALAQEWDVQEHAARLRQ
ncbi:MAG: SDR family oxidoreductase [Nitrococcus sp.]|nr:SDR family oxidoreductase [Nitrococcus sp.]